MTSTNREPGLSVGRPPDDQVIGELVAQVAATIELLSSRRSDLSVGDDWCNVDTALCGLHGAMIALRQLDRGSAEHVV